jgi:adenylate cyclase class 2
VAIEIEKKYRLSKKQRTDVLQRLPKIGAKRKGEEFEANTLYAGAGLDVGRSVLRLRRIGKRGILTFKERFPSRSDIKHQREDETRVADPDAMELILDALGFTPALVYEKRRETWRLGKAEIVIDELPFGLFMEIEGPEQDIRDIESKLAIKRLRAEQATYPQLALILGRNIGGIIEARF